MIKKSRLFWCLMGLMFIVQLGVPSSMIYKQNQVQRTGNLYKFELDAIDPIDPFRGKYIILNPKETNFELDSFTLKKTNKSYATFKIGENGFAFISNISNHKPNHSDYLQVKTSLRYSDNTSRRIDVSYPFDRYYMNENKAKPAEDLVREVLRDSLRTAYAEVRIKDGQHSLIDVKINDKSLNTLLSK